MSSNPALQEKHVKEPPYENQSSADLSHKGEAEDMKIANENETKNGEELIGHHHRHHRHILENRISLLTMTEKSPHPRYDKAFNCSSWSRRRIVTTVLGSLCAALVCTARLLIDKNNLTYLIHSIIILVDMLIIHIFTHTPWLSLSGEGITIASVILFHFTKQKVFELLETTLLAAICSLHMIFSRDEHWEREEQLEKELVGFIGVEIHTDEEHADVRRSTGVDRSLDDEHMRNSSLNMSERTVPKNHIETSCVHLCGRRFFEHFLDGSAGVMYTSFAGLILDEVIRAVRGQGGGY